ncbi:hypothetical protein THH46_24005 [Pseudomonas sp. NA13]
MDEINVRLHQHRRWLLQSEGLTAQELDYIDEDLASDSLNGLDNVADSLGMLATYHGIRGEVAISDGEASGWEQVSRSMMYRYWALMLKAKAFSKTSFLQGIQTVPNLTNQLSLAGCLLAGLITVDRRDLAASVADVLAGMLTVKGAVDSSYLEQRRFEPFMLWLYSVYSQGAALPEIKSLSLGCAAAAKQTGPLRGPAGASSLATGVQPIRCTRVIQHLPLTERHPLPITR